MRAAPEPHNILPKFKEPLQKRSRETRRKIISAARELFSAMGFDRTTTLLIAERANLSVGGLYAHFRNKEELFLYILEQRSRDTYQVTRDCIQEILKSQMPLKEGIEYFFTTIYKAHIRYGSLNMEMDKFTRMNPVAREIHDSWENNEMHEIGQWLGRYENTAAVGDLDGALIVICRATHEVFHYLYKARNQVDETKVLQSLILMFQRFLRVS